MQKRELGQIERIARSVHGILWEADAETFEFLYVSPQSEEILGYEPDQWYKSKTFWKDHIHPEDRKRAIFYCHQQTKLGQSHEFEYRMISSDGSIVWLKDVVSVIVDNDTPTKLRGLMVDITKQKEEEYKRLRLLKKSYTKAKIGHWEYDISAKSLYWSEEVKKIHEVGQEYEPDLESALAFYQEGNHREKAKNLVDQAIKTGEFYEAELKIITAKGNEKWIRVVGETVMEDGECKVIYGSTQDITDRKKEQEQLETLSLVASETQNIVIITDPNECILWVNSAFERKTGYLSTEVIGKKPGTLLQGPDTDSETIHRIARKINRRVPFNEKILNYTKDGHPYWVRIQVTPIFNEQGELEKFFSIQEDITKTERAKRQRRELNDLIQNSFSEIYVLASEDFKIKYLNDIASKNLGYNKIELIGKSPLDLNPEYSDMEKLRDLREKLYETEEGIEFESIHQRADGSQYPVRVFLKLGTYKGEEIFIASAIDITEQKQFENKLKEQITFSNSIINSLPGMFYMMDENLKLVKVNKNAKRFFGIEDSNLSEIDPFSVVDTKEREELKTKLEEANKNGFIASEVTVKLEDKEYIFYVNGKPIELGEHKYIIGNGIDITERIEAQRHNRVLLQEIHHRVKNNLAIVSGLLRLEMEELEDERSKLPMQRCTNRIYSIAKVHELLYDNERLSRVNIAEYIQELTHIVESTFSYQRKVKVDLNIDDIDMNANEAIPLGMLLNELLTNSYKYAFDDNEGEITIMIKKPNGCYKVLYKDNGKGFNETINLDEADTLGMSIINTLLQQLDADYELYTSNKFELNMEFDPKLKGSHSNLSV